MAKIPKELEIDFDGNWKEIIIEFFEDFIAFFIPDLYPHIDFSRPIEVLEQELIQILEAIGSDTSRIADKLVKVWLKNGTSQWILVHIEIQSYFEKLFSKRMYQMFSMIFNKYDHKIVALAIYTNTKTPRLFDKFLESNFGTTLIYKFLAYRIMRQNETELLASSNIFSLFVLSNYYVNKTRNDFRQRLTAKEKMIELAIERNIRRDKIDRFLFFIDNIMKIPLNLQEEFDGFLNSLFKIPTQMPSVLDQNRQYWTDRFNFYRYGDTVENLLEKEREKEREKDREVVLKLHFQKKWAAAEIADVLDIALMEVEKIIVSHTKG